MLNIFNNLEPFFNDYYRRISVREYSRIKEISPPSASKLLDSYYKEKLLKKEKEKIYIYYYANKESLLFINLSRAYWHLIIEKSNLLEELQFNFLNPVVYLFGSLSKAEAKKDSDIDIAIFSNSKKEISIEKYERKLKRNIQLFIYKDLEDIKNRELMKNVLNGVKLIGNW